MARAVTCSPECRRRTASGPKSGPTYSKVQNAVLSDRNLSVVVDSDSSMGGGGCLQMYGCLLVLDCLIAVPIGW